MAKGFVYLIAVIDWTSRKVLAAKIAITLEACNAVNVLQEAFNYHGTPGIVNTDQGSQFTADEFVKAHQELAAWTPGRMISWAAKTRTATPQVVEIILSRKAYSEHGFRSCMGIISLAKRYSEERLEKACVNGHSP